MISKERKIVATLLIMICVFCSNLVAYGDFNVNDYSDNELASIYSVISNKIFGCVKVPAGIYVVGKDLPAGTYTVLNNNDTSGNTAEDFSHVAIFNNMEEYKQSPDDFFSDETKAVTACNTLWSSFSYELTDGMVLAVKMGKAGITKVNNNIFASFWGSEEVIETQTDSSSASTENNGEQNASVGSTTSESNSSISIFHAAEYSVYNMKASENGLEGDTLLLEGTITSYTNMSGTEYIIIQQEDGNRWMIIVGQVVGKGGISGKRYESSEGKKVKVYCKYSGFSGVVKLPACDVMRYGGVLFLDENEFVCSNEAEILMSKDGISVNDFIQ